MRVRLLTTKEGVWCCYSKYFLCYGELKYVFCVKCGRRYFYSPFFNKPIEINEEMAKFIKCLF